MRRLLDQWIAARHASTSALIEDIGARFTPTLAALPSKKADAVRTWLNAVKVEPPEYLSARLAQLEQLTRTTSDALVWPVFEALSRLPPDPRIATLATRLLLARGPHAATAKLLRRLFDCVETHGDDSHCRALELGFPLGLLDDGLAARAVRLLQRGLAHQPVGPEMPAAERERLRAQAWPLPPVAPAADPLQAVYDAPDDEARRLVLADVLLEQGDPRGEFITLQRAGGPVKRQQALLKKHQVAWLGPLADLVDWKAPLRFELGFVSELSLRAVKRTQFVLAADAREWATVTRVRRGLQVLSPAMRALRHAGLVGLPTLEAWARQPHALPLQSFSVEAEPQQLEAVLSRAPSGVPRVTLALAHWAPTRSLRDGLASLVRVPGLEALRLVAGAADVVPSLLKEMGLDWLPPTVGELAFDDDGERRVHLRREARGAWALEVTDVGTLHLAQWKPVLRLVQLLPFARIELLLPADAPDDARTELEAHLKQWRKPVTVRSLPAESAALLPDWCVHSG